MSNSSSEEGVSSTLAPNDTFTAAPQPELTVDDFTGAQQSISVASTVCGVPQSMLANEVPVEAPETPEATRVTSAASNNIETAPVDSVLGIQSGANLVGDIDGESYWSMHGDYGNGLADRASWPHEGDRSGRRSSSASSGSTGSGITGIPKPCNLPRNSSCPVELRSGSRRVRRFETRQPLISGPPESRVQERGMRFQGRINDATLHSVHTTRSTDSGMVQIRIVSDPLDAQRLRVDLNGVQKYQIVQIPHHFHEWLLVGEGNRPVAAFRASRIYWWIHLHTLDPERPPVQLQPSLTCGLGRMEWYRQGYGTLRLSRSSLAVHRVRDSSVEMPELATLGPLPDLPSFLHNHVDFSVAWRQSSPEITAPIVVSTSFIAMWRWSRQTPLLNTLSSYVLVRLQQWLHQNIQAEQLERLDVIGLDVLGLRAQHEARRHAVISASTSIRSDQSTRYTALT